MTKFLLILLITILGGCASTDSYNNEQIRTQCVIGYHEEFVRSIRVSTKEGESRTKDEFRCVADKN